MGIFQKFWVCPLQTVFIEVNTGGFEGNRETIWTKEVTYLAIDDASYWGKYQLFTYYFYVIIIPEESHKFLICYGGEGGGMVDNRKVRNFLEGIKFGPMDSGKARVIYYSQTFQIFNLNIYYLAIFLQKKNKV